MSLSSTIRSNNKTVINVLTTNGDIGLQGPTGATGRNGAIGFTGATGDIGPTGSFDGSFIGDVTGIQSATVVSLVGAKTATNVANVVNDVESATFLNTNNTLVRRSPGGDISVKDLSAVNVSLAGGIISLPSTGSATIGCIIQNGSTWMHSAGTDCHFAGKNAGNTVISSGPRSTGVGVLCMSANSGGADCSGFGYNCMRVNTGQYVSGFGSCCLQANNALFSTAFGSYALQANTTATTNVGFGFEAGYSVTVNNHNSYFGFRSGKFLTGGGNTLIGSECCSIGVGVGGENTIVGQFGYRYGYGSQNCFLGAGCGQSLTSGSQHIAIGYYAGGVNQTGNNTISIGYAMNASSTTESNSCRISNIRGVTTIDNDAVAVLVSSTGQLGTVSSTREKKENIILLDDTTEKIKKLKPSSFNFKCHCYAEHLNGCCEDCPIPCPHSCKCSQSTTVGLIYDEVIDVIPEICVTDNKGEPATIQYHLLPIYMLKAQQEQIKRIETLENQLADVINRLNNLEKI